MRAYLAAYREWNAPASKRDELPDTPMMRLVKLNDFRRQFGREPVMADE